MGQQERGRGKESDGLAGTHSFGGSGLAGRSLCTPKSMAAGKRVHRDSRNASPSHCTAWRRSRGL